MSLTRTFQKPSSAKALWALLVPAGIFATAIGTATYIFFSYFPFERLVLLAGCCVVSMMLTAYLAFRIHRVSLKERTRKIADASRIHLATVEALASAIDARDQVGAGHVRRTQIYATGIGELLGATSKEIDALRTGALLHDIGKLAIPDHILNKPGRLTPAELEKTRVHALVGASIIEQIGFDFPVVPTIKFHHERWDGRGYPEGLKGKDIPLTARILAVADAYDTLRVARPYRPPVNREEACNLLTIGAGTQFDPTVVNIFLKNLERFESRVNEQGLAYAEHADDPKQHISDAELASENRYVEQIKRANREVFELYEIARELGSSVNLHETLERFTTRISALVPFDTCSVFLPDEGGEFATPAHSAGKTGAAFKGRRIKVGEGPTGEVLATGKPVRNVGPQLDFPLSQKASVSEYVTMMSVPLLAEDELIGAVSLYSGYKFVRYEREHLRLLETIAKMGADAILKSKRHLITETYALTDPMTGLPNARSLQMQFEREVGRAVRTSSAFQLLMLDLDGFKSVNDTFGHKIGDRMLKEISAVILGQLRDYDFLARYAGDEFVALIADTGIRDVAELCSRIETAVSEFALTVDENSTARVGVSLGSASYPEDGATFDDLIIEADKAMYSQKSVRKLGPELPDDAFVVEIDESHIVSTAGVH